MTPSDPSFDASADSPDHDAWSELHADTDPRSDVTREFWGSETNWPAADPRPTRDENRGLGGTVRRWWNSTGSVPVTRSHRSSFPAVAPIDDTDELLADWAIDEWPSDDEQPAVVDVRGEPRTVVRVQPELFDDEPLFDDAPVTERWDEPRLAPRPGVDPLLARLGGLAVIATLAVPAVLGFMADSDDGDALMTAPVASVAPGTPADAASVADTAAAATTPAPVTDALATSPPATEQPAEAATTSATAATSTSAATAAPAVTAAVDPAPEQLAASCAVEYDVVVGDFWIRLADGSGVSLADLLAVNAASVDTPLFPGATICLPAGATTPPPPPVATTPPSTSPNRNSGANNAGSTSTAAPTTTPRPTTPPTTAAPTTAAPMPSGANASASEVQAIIRSVWPDELEERALQIAWRESNYIPTAKNFCCYGVFQIYWSVHKSWLAGIGVTSANQLYDPATNARAALALYERAGGWGPWGF